MVIKLKDDDLRAFNEIYHRMIPLLYGFLANIYHNQDLIEEVCQEVFIKIWECRHQIIQEYSFKNYIFTIAKNRIYDHLQKEKRKLEVYAKVEFPESTNVLEETLHFNDMQNCIDRTIENLPESQQKIFIMSRQQYLSNKEIAMKLKISERTVENQIYKVLKKLKKELMQNDNMLPLLIFLFFCS